MFGPSGEVFQVLIPTIKSNDSIYTATLIPAKYKTDIFTYKSSRSADRSPVHVKSKYLQNNMPSAKIQLMLVATYLQ